MRYIGLPQWQHNGWGRFGMRTLADYARQFNCVEGNTTFYALPDRGRVMEWRAMTPDHFRFCFKFPASISHQAALLDTDALQADFFQALSPLADRIGQYWLQLPATFGPEGLERLWTFLDGLPQGFSYGVEVRHPLFFAKQEDERRLNQGLHQRKINRVVMDSRPVHAAMPTSAALLAAKKQKPNVPVHALLTADRPLVRFIGADSLDDNLTLFSPWLDTLDGWRSKACPFLFIHTPDIAQAPELAQALWPLLAEKFTDMPAAPDWPQQNLLF
ncbi:DUF72 domain-containing protein [Biostraticola tofi]|uniref:Uncharacterized protein YecE (DUF72 family) n=1 Tax=Biostraticola tofi TaxID=466109 RepID=A0A4R3Z4C6_9GAMM|nr:DUF72 domain-containing protein [Biostraticola tofi]TCW00037.1 uncharacterized protein YecE (DUF72 family) [Biostraticola tofi]